MTLIKIAGRVALTAAAAATMSLVALSPANAATPAGLCGSGYYQIDSHSLRYGKIYLLYNGSVNCVVTMKTSYVGTPTLTSAYVLTSQSNIKQDQGNFSQYAGPVKISAKGVCIQWGGGVSSSTDDGWDVRDVWTSDLEHCD
ncbi:hypothetical protein [Nocardia sp. NPDC052112]|uniref:hypothetical protein n=1 Tax=Nocardia sp. NPDC052112 TaxID=3155646 RepID=UPI003419DCD3